MEKELLDEIEAYLAANPMGETYFGKVSCGNSELIRKLRTGRTITLETYQRVRAFLDQAPTATTEAA